MFDFTREITLQPKAYKTYRRLQIFLYLSAFLAVLYLGYLIVFPQKNFFFVFSDPDANGNNIYNPRVKDSGYPEGGKVPAGRNLVFNTNITSDYSKAEIKIVFGRAPEMEFSGKISVRRSYQAFLFPEGEIKGFRNGTLVKNQRNYYIVSQDRLRRFANIEILGEMGYAPSQFKEVSEEDLKYNEKGSEVGRMEYVDDMLFKIDDGFHVLRNGELQKFVSDQAFLSMYEEEKALEKDSGFFEIFPLSETQAGYADGSLVSNGDSVYILSAGKFFPIDSALTFESKGYHWEDVVPAGLDEISIYEKEKIFNIKTPHPDGTVLKTKESSQYYLIENEKKLPLPTEAVAMSWTRKSPIEVSRKALDVNEECVLEKKPFRNRAYRCTMPLENFSDLIGFSYEFEFTPEDDIELETVSVNFEKNINKNNFKAFLTNLYYSIKTNYAFL